MSQEETTSHGEIDPEGEINAEEFEFMKDSIFLSLYELGYLAAVYVMVGVRSIGWDENVGRIC